MSARISPWWGLTLAVIALGWATDPRLGLVLALWLGLWGMNAGLTASLGRAAGWVVPAVFALCTSLTIQQLFLAKQQAHWQAMLTF